MCSECGKIGNPVDFVTDYKGEKRRNPGLCKECEKKKDDEREKIKLDRMQKANTCPYHNLKLEVRRRRDNGVEYLACPNYPYNCKFTKSIF